MDDTNIQVIVLYGNVTAAPLSHRNFVFRFIFLIVTKTLGVVWDFDIDGLTLSQVHVGRS